MHDGMFVAHFEQNPLDTHFARRAADQNGHFFGRVGKLFGQGIALALAQPVVDGRGGHGPHAGLAAAERRQGHGPARGFGQGGLVHAGGLLLGHIGPFAVAGGMVQDGARVDRSREVETPDEVLGDVHMDEIRAQGLELVLFQGFPAGAAARQRMGGVEAQVIGLLQQRGQGGPVALPVLAVGLAHAGGQQGIAAAQMLVGNEHGHFGPQQQVHGGHADGAGEHRSATAREIEHGFRSLTAFLGDEDGALVEFQALGKAAQAQRRIGAAHGRILDAVTPESGHKAHGPAVKLLAVGHGLGGHGHALGRSFDQIIEDLGLDGMAAATLLVEEVAQPQGHLAGFDLDRAHARALAAGRAVVGDGAQLFKQPRIGLAPGDLGIIDGLDDRAEADVLVARVVEHAVLRGEHGADLLALAAAVAELDAGQDVDEGILVRQGGLFEIPDQAVKREGVGLDGQSAGGELARVDDVLGIDPLFVGAQGVDLGLFQKGDLGDADAVFARDRAAELGDLLEHLLGRFPGMAQHLLVIGIDRDVDVAVAVAGVHVARDLDAGGGHVGMDGGEPVLELGITRGQVGEEIVGLDLDFAVGELPGGELATQDPIAKLQLHGDEIVGGRNAGQTAGVLQGVTVGVGHAVEVQILQEFGEFRHDIQRDDHVLVDLEARGALGDGRELVAVFPVEFGGLGVLGLEHVHVVVGVDDVHDVGGGTQQRVLVVGIELEQQDRNGFALVEARFFDVTYRPHILGVEFLQGRNLDRVAFLADAVAQVHHVADHAHGVFHGAAEKLQAQGARILGNGIEGEAGFGNDAVHAFLLHAGKAPEELVGHVLAEVFCPDLVAGELDHVAHGPGLLDDLKNGRLIGPDLVARVIDPAHLDDFPGGLHHLVADDVIQGGAVFEGERAAGVLGDVAAERRRGLGRRVHGEKQALGRGRLDGGHGDDTGLGAQGHGLGVDVQDALELGQAEDDRAPMGRDGAAGQARAAAPGNDGEFELVGQAQDVADVFHGLGQEHAQGHLHAQIRGVGGTLDQGMRRGDHVLGRHEPAQTFDQIVAETAVRLENVPEGLVGPADGTGILAPGFGVGLTQAFFHRGLDIGRVDERIGPHEEQLGGHGHGEVFRILRPGFELVGGNIKDPWDESFKGQGNMGRALRHSRRIFRRRLRSGRCQIMPLSAFGKAWYWAYSGGGGAGKKTGGSLRNRPSERVWTTRS